MRSAHPALRFEQSLWDCGIQCLAGVDEAGRGALAGPLVAAAVTCESIKHIRRLLQDDRCSLIRDSKTLSLGQRLEARALIEAHIDSIAVGIVPAEEIDFFGLAAANRMAMERAVTALQTRPEFLLIDAMTIDHEASQWGIIDGDAHSLLISAASIVAKVARDSIMVQMGEQFGAYAFSKHRGYGTAQHLDELDRTGPCEIHRMSFEPIRSRSGCVV